MDLSKYKEMFIQECKEHLQSMNDSLLQFEQNQSNPIYIDTLFRDTHSIKGMAASMGYTEISELSHKLEDLLDHVRTSRVNISTELINILFEGLDVLETQVNELISDQEQLTDGSELLERIAGLYDEITTGEEIPKPESLVPDSSPEEFPESIDNEPEYFPEDLSGDTEYGIRIHISPSAQLPLARVLIIEKKLKAMGTILDFLPSMNDVKAGRFDHILHIRISSEESLDNIIGKINEIPEIDKIEQIEDSPETEMIKKPDKPVEKKNKPKKSVADKPKPSAPVIKSRLKSSKIRVDIKLLDQLMNSVGELIITKSRLKMMSKEFADREMLITLDQLEHLVNEIHTNLMVARMLPFEIIANRFPRVVRDLSMRAGKEIEFKVSGSEIELDRVILDDIGDPLIHILRNAIDHGIESPAERAEKGKPGKGRINLTATREKESVYIEVDDDGAGIDPQIIKQKAVEKGILNPEQSEILSDDEIIQFICVPGFSTSETITDISGRGVGMDVVKTQIESIGGTLDITSELGKGSRFSLKLPLTVAIIDVLLTRQNKSMFAFPLSKVDRTLEVSSKNIIVSRNQTLLETAEGIIPLLNLAKVLNMENHTELPSVLNVIIIELKRKKTGLIVDELLGQEEMVIKPLGPPLERIKGFSGVSILGDGQPVLILDILNLLR